MESKRLEERDLGTFFVFGEPPAVFPFQIVTRWEFANAGAPAD
jgi:hypothetical protein